MSTKYAASLANSSHLPALKDFIVKFYKLSDTKPPADLMEDLYVQSFRPDSILKIGLITAEGTEKIGQLRQGMWKFVTQRHHVVLNVAPVSDVEYFVNGYVDYTLTNGKQLTSEWAGYIDFGEVGQVGRTMKFYQVYLDSTQMKDALK
ncbi:hypothetical protein BABINDRAFT_93335 [Babjeviella inositovora NRRL Y-12698]|uniref:SnoaL-like domain-containing protein n=1 Tax=Babjeviella inositovora NRRL Y-12698 TaxID=984486 RepID=A0A1E3QKC0_9ASCO|nr:uncharacterized protein BABINDRAFT_93335 [Babjeviella inositovora NRRL Y-12698]ODQ78131.1 hypothetical protein BABINDRAFT_93335 [Babjeviella inositovora NRRL Y-12698]